MTTETGNTIPAKTLKLADLKVGDEIEFEGDNDFRAILIVLKAGRFPSCSMLYSHGADDHLSDAPANCQLIGFAHYPNNSPRIDRFNPDEIDVNGGSVLIFHGINEVMSGSVTLFTVRRNGHIVMHNKQPGS